MCDVRCGLSRVVCCFGGVVVLCAIGAQAGSLPADPTNAALLYYRAFLLCPEPNAVEQELVHNAMLDRTYEYLGGAPIPFDPNVEPRLRELEARVGPRPRRFDKMTPDDFCALAELSSLRHQHARQEKMCGVDPNRAIRGYIRRCREALELAQDASKLPECDWGIQHSKGIASRLPQSLEIRSLGFVLQTDALIHAADGDYRAAFERCLLLRRIAEQVGDDTYFLYCVSKSLDGVALRCIRAILGCTEPDADTLEWLKHQLDDGGMLSPPAKSLRVNFEHVLQTLRNNTSMLDKVREAMRLNGQIRSQLKQEPWQVGQDVESLTDEDRKEVEEIMTLFGAESERPVGDVEVVREAEGLTDDELIALASQSYAAFLESALAVMDSDLPYRDKMSELNRLKEEIENEYGDNRVARRTLLTHPEGLLGLSVVMASRTDLGDVYTVHLCHLADVNVLMAGIEVHLINARQGGLPEMLPEGLPKDPFTGRDFKYEITEDGFTLSVRDQDIAGDRRRPYAFRVR